MQHFTALAAIALYFTGFLLLLDHIKKSQKQTPRVFNGVFLLAIICHCASLNYTIFADHILHIGFFNVSSLLFCVIASISFIAFLRNLAIDNLILMLLPCAMIAVILAYWSPVGSDKIISETGLIIHIVLSLVAYSLITLAMLQAILLGAQERQLRQHHFSGLFRYLPPLQTMESLLFDMIWAGTTILTLSILSGFVFLDDMFAQHLSHKTVLSIVAWLLFSTLLWGHHYKGWRGKVAVKWTILGFTALMLAYFGSKFVLEILLSA